MPTLPTPTAVWRALNGIATWCSPWPWPVGGWLPAAGGTSVGLAVAVRRRGRAASPFVRCDSEVQQAVDQRSPPAGRGESARSARRTPLSPHRVALLRRSASCAGGRSEIVRARPMAASPAAIVITKIEKTWPGQVREPPREGDQVQIDGVQHQLDRHQDRQEVAPHEHAEEPDREEQEARRSGSG